MRIVVPECVGRARIVLFAPSFFDGLGGVAYARRV
jgi:hypothetical protein